MEKRASILVVEDEIVTRMALVQHLEAQGFAVLEAGSGDEALNLVKTTAPDLIVTDVQMPGWQDGETLALWVREHHPNIKLIIVSGAKLESAFLDELGAEGAIVPKPYVVEEIASQVAILLGSK